MNYNSWTHSKFSLPGQASEQQSLMWLKWQSTPQLQFPSLARQALAFNDCGQHEVELKPMLAQAVEPLEAAYKQNMMQEK